MVKLCLSSDVLNVASDLRVRMPATFSSIKNLSPLSRNTSQVLCLFVVIPVPTEVTILSTYQRTACVARPCWHPFRCLSTPMEESCEMSTAHHGSVRTPPTFGGGNANRAAPLHTEPTRTHWWKHTIIVYRYSVWPISYTTSLFIMLIHNSAKNKVVTMGITRPPLS